MQFLKSNGLYATSTTSCKRAQLKLMGKLDAAAAKHKHEHDEGNKRKRSDGDSDADNTEGSPGPQKPDKKVKAKE